MEGRAAGQMFKLTLEYDGTRFQGWQKQPGSRRTVQGELERVLKTLTHRSVNVIGAGRTDSGVHATGQVASVALAWDRGPERLAGAANSILPLDMSIIAAEEVEAGFHARYDACERHYRYLILRRRERSPVLERFACRVRGRLDVAVMRRAIARFRGKHDFSSYCTARARRFGAVRNVTRAVLGSKGPWIWLDVVAPSFLHRMVRLIAGAVIAAGGGRLPVKMLAGALVSFKSSPVASAAPACGLTLVAVRYPRQGKSAFSACNREAPCLV